MKVNMTNRATFSPRGATNLSRQAKGACEGFFAHKALPGDINLLVFRASPGGDARRLIKIVPLTTDFGLHPVGLPVNVHTEGTQGLICLLTVNGMETEEVRQVIEGGPYQHKKKSANGVNDTDKASDMPAEPVHDTPIVDGQTVSELEVVTTPTPGSRGKVATVATVAPAPPQPIKRFTPREKLVAWGVSEEEIDRLKATMSSIVYREVGDGDVPLTLQVSVEHITDAIKEHARLPFNKRGNYQGIIGSFYSSRISLFGEQFGISQDPKALYHDWFLDGPLILDFVEGRDSLLALARTREIEVAERRAAETAIEENPPPTAEAVQEVVLSGFMADAGVLEVVLRNIQGKKIAQGELDQAIENATSFETEIQRLEELIATARCSHKTALKLVEEARSRLAQYVLDAETVDKVRAAKDRLAALMADAGI